MTFLSRSSSVTANKASGQDMDAFAYPLKMARDANGM